ncbi:hypothetical protein HMPREF0379_0826 [[Eubacterium] yurii subsp. margaretiae ATCC 43715]|nr:hypothetical protein HMPREF0379_0826 [[Eubacterium] yurii subsp. margaretiae ATCC 43715]
MEGLKIKRKFLSLVLFFMVLLIMTACNVSVIKRESQDNTSKVDKDNVSYNFVRDLSLDKYNDKSLIDKVLNTSISDDDNNKKDTARAIGFISGTTIGADSPWICFVNDNYIGVLFLKGILIYEKSTGNLSTVIDTEGLGFKYTQGDEAILEKADNEYLILYKANENKGYIYSFKENALSKINDIAKANINDLMYSQVDKERFKKIQTIVGNSSVPVIYKDHYFSLEINYNDLKNSYVHVLDEKFNEILKFRLGDK